MVHADIFGGYSHYKKEIGAEIVLQVQAYQAVLRLNPPKNYIDVAEKIAATKANMSSEEYDIVTNSGSERQTLVTARGQIRNSTYQLLKLQSHVILEDLAKCENKYISAIAKNRHLPVITYSALSKIEIRQTRINSQQNLLRLSRSQPFSELSFDEWKSAVDACHCGQAELIKLSNKMLDHRAQWQKYVDDTWRLRFALWGITVAIFSLTLSQIPNWYNFLQKKSFNREYILLCSEIKRN